MTGDIEARIYKIKISALKFEIFLNMDNVSIELIILPP